MSIPSQISSAAEARSAVLDYRAWLHLPAGLFLDTFITAPFNRADRIFRDLDRTPGPGPAVHALPDDGEAFWVGVPKLPSGRTQTSVRVPAVGGPTAGAASTLTEVATSVPVVQALAARAAMAAETEERTRPARHLRDESDALITFAGQLEDLVPALAAPFLDDWRSQSARRSPGLTPPAPPVRALRLR